MQNKAACSVATATGDTTKTIIDTLQVPQGAKKIVGIWAYACAGAGTTTLENLTGIFEAESVDVNIQPCQLPLDCVVVLTSGTTSFSPRIFPMEIPVKGGEKIAGYVTMDMAITVANKARFGLIYEF